MSGLDTWKKLSVFDVVLPSGIEVKGRFLDMEQAVTSGQFDVAVLTELDKRAGEKNGEGPNHEQIAEGLKYKQWCVCANVLEVSGESVELTADDYKMLPEADRDILFGYINRTVPVPLVGG